jgi:hypothetical protein
MLAIFIFSNFHFNGRQLFLWFAIALPASADAGRWPVVKRNA